LSLSIVVPCYNEADNAPRVRADLLPVAVALRGAGPVEVIFVDDGSTDATQQVFTGLSFEFERHDIRARVVPHGRNRGLGAALRTGFEASTGDVVVTTDSDATYRFQEIPALLTRLTEAVDLVTASPYHPDGSVAGVSRHRLVLSQGSSWLYRRLVTPDIHTYTALFRAYRRRVLDHVRFSSDGFLAGTEILVNAVLSGFKAVEYPTTLHSRAHGTSKAKLARTIAAHLRFLGRVLMGRLGLAAAPWTPGLSTTIDGNLPARQPRPVEISQQSGGR
jgi:dolichol-phosphate mannosyltransferase